MPIQDPVKRVEKLPKGWGEFSAFSCKIALRKLSLPKTTAENIDRIVAPRDVFSKVELRQQLGARRDGRRFDFLVFSARHCSLGALRQRQMDGLLKCQQLFRGCCYSAGTNRKGKKTGSKTTRNNGP